MFSRFFIDRPNFASVLSILIVLAGGIAFFGLPIAQYPPVAPPTVQVDCNYPGASASSSKLSIQLFLRIWSKRIVTICEISHALESKPKCLSSWFRFFAVHISTE